MTMSGFNYFNKLTNEKKSVLTSNLLYKEIHQKLYN